LLKTKRIPPSHLPNCEGSVKADREGDALVLKPLAEKAPTKGPGIVDSLPTLEGRLADPAMTFHREDIYGPDAG
jgi:hypothetical protein